MIREVVVETIVERVRRKSKRIEGEHKKQGRRRNWSAAGTSTALQEKN